MNSSSDDESYQSKGGKVRAENLPPETRRSIAIKAAQARWQRPQLPEGQSLPKAVAEGVLKIGNIPCAVLDDPDNTRVLTQEGFLLSIGRAGRRGSHGRRVARFFAREQPKTLYNQRLGAVDNTNYF